MARTETILGWSWDVQLRVDRMHIPPRPVQRWTLGSKLRYPHPGLRPSARATKLRRWKACCHGWLTAERRFFC